MCVCVCVCMSVFVLRAFTKQDIYCNLLTKRKTYVLNNRCSLQSQAKMEGQGQLFGNAGFRCFVLWGFFSYLEIKKK